MALYRDLYRLLLEDEPQAPTTSSAPRTKPVLARGGRVSKHEPKYIKAVHGDEESRRAAERDRMQIHHVGAGYYYPNNTADKAVYWWDGNRFQMLDPKEAAATRERLVTGVPGYKGPPTVAPEAPAAPRPFKIASLSDGNFRQWGQADDTKVHERLSASIKEIESYLNERTPSRNADAMNFEQKVVNLLQTYLNIRSATSQLSRDESATTLRESLAHLAEKYGIMRFGGEEKGGLVVARYPDGRAALPLDAEDADLHQPFGGIDSDLSEKIAGSLETVYGMALPKTRKSGGVPQAKAYKYYVGGLQKNDVKIGGETEVQQKQAENAFGTFVIFGSEDHGPNRVAVIYHPELLDKDNTPLSWNTVKKMPIYEHFNTMRLSTLRARNNQQGKKFLSEDELKIQAEKDTAEELLKKKLASEKVQAIIDLVKKGKGTVYLPTAAAWVDAIHSFENLFGNLRSIHLCGQDVQNRVQKFVESTMISFKFTKATTSEREKEWDDQIVTPILDMLDDDAHLRTARSEITEHLSFLRQLKFENLVAIPTEHDAKEDLLFIDGRAMEGQQHRPKGVDVQVPLDENPHTVERLSAKRLYDAVKAVSVKVGLGAANSGDNRVKSSVMRAVDFVKPDGATGYLTSWELREKSLDFINQTYEDLWGYTPNNPEARKKIDTFIWGVFGDTLLQKTGFQPKAKYDPIHPEAYLKERESAIAALKSSWNHGASLVYNVLNKPDAKSPLEPKDRVVGVDPDGTERVVREWLPTYRAYERSYQDLMRHCDEQYQEAWGLYNEALEAMTIALDETTVFQDVALNAYEPRGGFLEMDATQEIPEWQKGSARKNHKRWITTTTNGGLIDDEGTTPTVMKQNPKLIPDAASKLPVAQAKGLRGRKPKNKFLMRSGGPKVIDTLLGDVTPAKIFEGIQYGKRDTQQNRPEASGLGPILSKLRKQNADIRSSYRFFI